MQALLVLTLQLFFDKSYGVVEFKPKDNPKKHVIAIFEEYEKKRETKWPHIKARL